MKKSGFDNSYAVSSPSCLSNTWSRNRNRYVHAFDLYSILNPASSSIRARSEQATQSVAIDHRPRASTGRSVINYLSQSSTNLFSAGSTLAKPFVAARRSVKTFATESGPRWRFAAAFLRRGRQDGQGFPYYCGKFGVG